MGFWSSLGSIITAPVRAVASVTSALVNGASKIVSGVSDWVKENVFGLYDTPSYVANNATVEETKKVNQLLEKCIESYREKAEEYDEIAAKIVSEQFENLKEKLYEVNLVSSEKIIENYVFEIFEDNLEKIKKSLDKIYSKQISNVFSLNNKKLLDILELEKGKRKKEKLRELAIETISNANTKLMNELSQFLEQQSKFIEKGLNDYMEKIKNIAMANENETKKILDAKSKDISVAEGLKIRYLNLLQQLELLEQVLLREA